MDNENNLVYSPGETERNAMRGVNYWEVWRGLPQVEFNESDSTAGRALRYTDDEGNYIWVPFPARVAHETNPESVFLALVEKSLRKRIVPFVRVSEENLEDSIKHAEILNQRNMKPSRSK